MYYIIIDISFIFCFLGISLLYKDNDPYVVIGILFFILCLLVLGSMIISGIINNPLWRDPFHISIFILFVLYVIIYHRLGDKDYH
jgi:hypothetical protein